jgi:hypothetical protein
MEQWKVIKSHPNYEISNLGRVRNIQTNEYKQTKPCKNGYVKVNLYPGPKVFMVHRLVAEYFLPKVHNKPLVNHIDSVRHNNFVSNLEWCTYKENAQHMVNQKNNPDVNGTNNPRAKFTEQDVIDIRNDNRPVSIISEKYKVAETTITNIKNGTRYKNIGGPIRAKGYKGNQVKGSRTNTSKLTEKDVYSIKYNMTEASTKEVMEKYKISSNVVYKIRNNVTWKHV